jgi:hypothetical protein
VFGRRTLTRSQYLEEGRGGKARNYGLLGAYGRALFWSLGALGVALAIFLLLRIG